MTWVADHLWWHRYRRYLRSPHWLALRHTVLRRDGFKCTLCGSGLHLEVDHLSYITYNRTGKSQAEECRTLCRQCHRKATRMARKRRLEPAMYKPPTPQEQFDYSLKEAVEKAILAHPQTVKLRKEIEKEMRAAAKTPSNKKRS